MGRLSSTAIWQGRHPAIRYMRPTLFIGNDRILAGRMPLLSVARAEDVYNCHYADPQV